MKITNYFLPLRKELPSEASVVSHKLMLKSGMIKQVSSGLYAWLPLGYKVLRKFEQVIREEMDKFGFIELLMPTVQPIDLWQESGRGNCYGLETLRFKDRHGKEFVYGPTAEEVVTFLVKNEIKSYRNLPLSLYNMQWKFRDEIRPRFGVMRCREFLMLDSYSFDYTIEDAKKTYNNHYDCFLSIFSRLGLTAIPMQADTGEIGGDLSHEFHVLADTGESEIIYDKDLDLVIEEVRQGKVQNIRDKISKFYAVTDEKYVESECPIKPEKLQKKRGIEVGHIFYFGDKYSKTMGLNLMDAEGKSFVPEMGSYGIGVGRLVAAFIEANHDQNGIIWNKQTSPFDCILINLATKDSANTQVCDELYKNLKASGVDVLYDDRDETVGVKFSTADLLGIPIQLIISPRNAGKIELRDRKTKESKILDTSEVIGLF